MKDIYTLLNKSITISLISLLVSIPVVAVEDNTSKEYLNKQRQGDINLIMVNMVFIPGGEFIMGNSESVDEDERPAVKVYVGDFYINKYEIANEAYNKFIIATGHTPPPFWKDNRFKHSNHPVVGVSFHDAVAYTKWAGQRLPTEAEWEKAAKGDGNLKWPWGNNKPRKKDILFYLNSFGRYDNYEYTAPVDYYPAGISPYGVYNMLGNVWEWCSDWYEAQYYSRIDTINPTGPESGNRKVLRGGAWSNSFENISITRRISNFPDVQLDIYGFRTAITPPDNFPEKLRSLLNSDRHKQ